MPQQDWLALMGMGGGFILLGIIAIIWGRREEKGYYNSLSDHRDVREFMEHWPPRPQFGSLKIGGRIAIIIGVLMLAGGIGIRLWA
ncbi:MAG: hypothetical protein HY529_02135 [Chloroflexi bacterium]|nr:hypothetical protein [Chloroflexota bacterium]